MGLLVAQSYFISHLHRQNPLQIKKLAVGLFKLVVPKFVEELKLAELAELKFKVQMFRLVKKMQLGLLVLLAEHKVSFRLEVVQVYCWLYLLHLLYLTKMCQFSLE